VSFPGCGRKKKREGGVSLIYGGGKVPRGEHPWQAAIFTNSGYCGGSLVSRTAVLTGEKYAHYSLKQRAQSARN